MVLITGGAYQGKLDYALDFYKLTKENVYFGNEIEPTIDFSRDIIYNLELTILSQLKNEVDSLKYISDNLDGFIDKIIICKDISCGVVPIDNTLRGWRESVGRSTSYLARNSERVVRVFCGIPTILK